MQKIILLIVIVIAFVLFIEFFKLMIGLKNGLISGREEMIKADMAKRRYKYWAERIYPVVVKDEKRLLEAQWWKTATANDVVEIHLLDVQPGEMPWDYNERKNRLQLILEDEFRQRLLDKDPAYYNLWILQLGGKKPLPKGFDAIQSKKFLKYQYQQ